MCERMEHLKIEHSESFLQILWKSEKTVINIDELLRLTELLTMANVRSNSPFLIKKDCGLFLSYTQPKS